MKKRNYICAWLSNVSVGTIIVGGFQTMPAWLRLFALIFATLAFFIGLALVKEN